MTATVEAFSGVIAEVMGDTLTRIAVWPCHTVPPHQQVPSSWIPLMTRLVVAASPKDTSTWLSTTALPGVAAAVLLL